jgi:two-component system, cell cycle response regulator DivK
VVESQLILVVEDNEQNLELVEFLLEDAGMRVRVAQDADAARAQLGEELPGLILMDMQLPGTDGLTLVNEIRKRPETATVPIIALTAHAMRGDRERFLAGGCDAYIPKPINAVTFVEEIMEVLSLVQQRSGRRADAP